VAFHDAWNWAAEGLLWSDAICMCPVSCLIFCEVILAFERSENPICFVQQVASPSSSELSSDMERLLQLNDEDDDATSKAAPMPSEMEQQPYDHPAESLPPHQVMLVIILKHLIW
jgi:hypothetical protein